MFLHAQPGEQRLIVLHILLVSGWEEQFACCGHAGMTQLPQHISKINSMSENNLQYSPFCLVCVFKQAHCIRLKDETTLQYDKICFIVTWKYSGTVNTQNVHIVCYCVSPMITCLRQSELLRTVLSLFHALSATDVFACCCFLEMESSGCSTRVASDVLECCVLPGLMYVHTDTCVLFLLIEDVHKEKRKNRAQALHSVQLKVCSISLPCVVFMLCHVCHLSFGSIFLPVWR